MSSTGRREADAGRRPRRNRRLSASWRCLTATALMGLFTGTGLQAATSPGARLPERIVEPVLGVPVDWDALERPNFSLYCESEVRDMRVLARVPAGVNALVFVQSLVGIRADIDPEPPPHSYEEDAGQLLKLMGVKAVQLGSSSGFPTTDYPEIRPDLMRELMRDYVRRLERLYPDTDELKRLIAEGTRCTDRDAGAQAVLVERGLAPNCNHAPQAADPAAEGQHES